MFGAKPAFALVVIGLFASGCSDQSREIPEGNLGEVMFEHKSEGVELSIRRELVNSEMGLTVGMSLEDKEKVLKDSGYRFLLVTERIFTDLCSDSSEKRSYTEMEPRSEKTKKFILAEFGFSTQGGSCRPHLETTLLVTH